ncbi:unnamed protein product, partial [marine sediment metagenome]
SKWYELHSVIPKHPPVSNIRKEKREKQEYDYEF